jgi:hypothetical protein
MADHPPGNAPSLVGVTAPMGRCAWAVGGWRILHWNGKRWRSQALPKA